MLFARTTRARVIAANLRRGTHERFDGGRVMMPMVVPMIMTVIMTTTAGVGCNALGGRRFRIHGMISVACSGSPIARRTI